MRYFVSAVAAVAASVLAVPAFSAGSSSFFEALETTSPSFADAVIASGIVDDVADLGTITILSPDETAFSQALGMNAADMIAAGEGSTLTEFIGCHMVRNKDLAPLFTDLSDKSVMVGTLGGCTLLTHINDGMIEFIDETGGQIFVTEVVAPAGSNRVLQLDHRLMSGFVEIALSDRPAETALEPFTALARNQDDFRLDLSDLATIASAIDE